MALRCCTPPISAEMDPIFRRALRLTVLSTSSLPEPRRQPTSRSQMHIKPQYLLTREATMATTGFLQNLVQTAHTSCTPRILLATRTFLLTAGRPAGPHPTAESMG